MEDHGFTDESVLSIFTSLLGKPCKTGFNITDGWQEAGPYYLNLTDGHKRAGRCYGWKSIPKRFVCGKVPINRSTLRLCPCVSGKGLVNSIGDATGRGWEGRGGEERR